MMKRKKWRSKIVLLAIVGTILNAYANDINCSLNTNCFFSSYNDYMYVPTIEKVDYKCHVIQKNNVSTHGAKPVINLVVGYGSVSYSTEKVELGGKDGNEGNLYFPSRAVEANGRLTFIVEKKSPYWVDKIADISINCIKI